MYKLYYTFRTISQTGQCIEVERSQFFLKKDLLLPLLNVWNRTSMFTSHPINFCQYFVTTAQEVSNESAPLLSLDDLPPSQLCWTGKQTHEYIYKPYHPHAK